MIYVVNKKRKIENIKKDFPNAVILDITSSSNNKKGQMLSPFFPHGNIPIPFTKNKKATCVEAVWQGLKVFESHDISLSTFDNDTMKDVKRSVRKNGRLLGHKRGIYGSKEELLEYFEARMEIYLPTYKWVLENVEEVKKIIDKIKEHSKNNDIVLLDYNINIDFRDITKPLSHAGLVKLYIEGNYPKESDKDKFSPMNQLELEEKKKREKLLKKEIKNKSKKVKNKEFDQLSLFDDI